MRTTRHSIRYVLSLVGIGLMLACSEARRYLRQTWNRSTIRMIGSLSTPGARKITGRLATPGGRRTLGDTVRPGLDWGMACPIITRFTKARSASCSASASEAAASIDAANTGANRQEGEPG
jgi:hypothetical protein